MDSVEPEIVDQVETAVAGHPGVQSIKRLRLRWVGHQLQGDLALSILPSADYHAVKRELRYAVQQVAPKLTDLAIEVVEGDDCERIVTAGVMKKN